MTPEQLEWFKIQLKYSLDDYEIKLDKGATKRFRKRLKGRDI